MTSLTKAMVVSSGAVLLFDLIASLASRVFGFPYARAAVGSYVLYVAIGYFAARNAAGSPLPTAILVAASAAFVDASLGGHSRGHSASANSRMG